MKLARLVALVAGSLIALVALAACDNASDRRAAANVDAMLASLTACPAPATCSRKAEASGRDVALCAPDPAPQSYVVGDVVVTKEMKNHDTLGRIVAHRGAAYEIQFPDDSKFERTPDRIAGRACR